jgi:hypothetical protein
VPLPRPLAHVSSGRGARAREQTGTQPSSFRQTLLYLHPLHTSFTATYFTGILL